MKRRTMPTRRLPDLKDFRQPRQVAGGHGDLWARLAEWQRQGLVSIRPDTNECATVSLTDAGRMRVEQEAP
jgi:hypothetical protein